MGIFAAGWAGAGLGLAAALVLAAPAAAQDTRAEREQRAELLAAYGGAYDGPQADYVARIGERMAAVAGMPDRCSFTIVNSQVVNAFAAPLGCQIYVTRGLLGIINTEAELAAVLGHEVGHVAAHHAARQQTQQALSGLAAALVGVVTKSDLAGAVASRAAKLGVLGYSRAQEYEADNLSLHYLPLAGYAPEGLAAVLADLAREDAFTAATSGVDRSVPVWASTHPLTADRIRRAEQGAAQADERYPVEIGAPAYLAAVDGLIYGDDPEQGFVNGRTFVHPKLGIAFEAPPGFQLANAGDAVAIQGPGGLRGEFAGGRASVARLEDYADSVLSAVAGGAPIRVGQARRTVINGLDAVVLPAQANTRDGPVEVTVAAYAVGGGRAYHFVAIAPAGAGGAFDAMIGSFRRLSEQEAAAIGPRRIRVTTVQAGDTPQSLSARMAGDHPLERFRMLNALEPGEPLAPGRRVKLVVDGAR